MYPDLLISYFIQDGFDTIDAAFKTFVNQTTIGDFQHYCFELQTTKNKYFKPEKIREYFNILRSNDGGVEACHLTAHYILVVLGEYCELYNTFKYFIQESTFK